MSKGLVAPILAAILAGGVLGAVDLPMGPIVPGRSVAGIELGMSEARMLELLGEPQVELKESRQYSLLHMTLFVREALVRAIIFTRACKGPDPFESTLEWAESIKTEEGISLGSSLEAVRAAFGAAEHEKRVSDTNLMLSYPSRGIQFQVGEVGVCGITISKARAEASSAPSSN